VGLLTKKFSLLHILVIIYLIAAFSWWAILLYQKNENNYQLQLQLATYDSSLDKSLIESSYQKQKNMIISEGIVLGLSIIFGLLLINRAYRSELSLNQRLNDFLLSVTHELKTPIASLQLVNKTLQREGLSPDKRKDLLKTGWDESMRLESQVNNILAAAQIEQSYKFNFEKIQLANLIAKRVRRFQKMFPDRIIKFLGKEATGMVNVDPESFTRAIDNLIHNALKYSEVNEEIKINISEKSGKVFTSVIDHGSGIPEIEKTKVWDKFYRIGNEETRDKPGTGLGLWIAKEIVRAHSGQLTLCDTKPNGSTFTISIPTAT